MINFLHISILIIFLALPKLVFSEALTIAVAANVQFAMNDIERAFEKQTGIDLRIIIGSSGKLTAQIRSGAPFDVFLSADMKYPQSLYQSGFAVTEPKVYAYGSLVVWSLKEEIGIDSLDFLLDDRISKIGIADPQLAPYGRASVSALKYYQLYDRVKSKCVYGSSVSTVNQYVISGATEVGFTAKSVVMSPKMKGKGEWQEVPRSAYTQIEQGAVILRHGKTNRPQASQNFIVFLFSETARKILYQYGYTQQ